MQIEQQKKHSYLDQFKIIKTLGAGYHAQVKLGVDETGRYVAIKKYKKETANLNTLKHELAIMKALDHENLVKLIDVRQNALYKNRAEKEYPCFAIILEYVGGGQLFDYIADTGKFSEKVARTYFHQMMNGLHYMHGKGYAHRDIKPQNILLSHEFVLKLADFGFSCLLKGKDNTGVLHTKLGTEGYMAPEIPSKNYEGNKTDIFAAGVILFIMYAGNPPFQKATPNDPYYKLIREKNLAVFWKAHSRRRPNDFFNEKFRDLFVRMVAFDPNERITVEQIAKHPWVAEPVCSYPDIKKEFSVRQETLDKVVQARRQEEEKKKEQRMNGMQGQGTQHRGEVDVDTPFFEAYNHEKDIKRELPHLEAQTRQDFVLKEELPYVITSLKDFLKNNKIIVEEINQDEIIDEEEVTALKAEKIVDHNGDKISVVFEYSYGIENEQIKESVEVGITLGRNTENNIVFSISREAGNQLYYKKILRELRNKFSYCLV